MSRAEIYKLLTHRTPLVCAAVLLLGVLIPSVVLVWYTPGDDLAYTDTFTSTYGALSVLLAIVFGGWLLGTEYRQGTVKRLLASEPRRLRALATKAVVGAGALSGVLAATAGIGWTAARVVGSMHEVTVPWTGRELLASAVIAMIGAVVAFGLSAITRSDAFAMVGTVVMLLVLDPLLSLIPKVGKYTFGSALDRVAEAVAGTSESFGSSALTTASASVTLAVWLVAIVGAGAGLFATRDI